MKILVTGAEGFIGKNLIEGLHNRGYLEVYSWGRGTTKEEGEKYIQNSDFLFHLAGVNRAKKEEEFRKDNTDFTAWLLDRFAAVQKIRGEKIPVLLASSIHAELDNFYGVSKKAAEDAVLSYGKQTGAKVFCCRLPNVFGKWCRPNYNSVVATFCHNIAHGISIRIDNPETSLKLVYIDDVVETFITCMEKSFSNQCEAKDSYLEMPVCYTVTLQELASILYGFYDSRHSLQMPGIGNDFQKKLYSTYISYLPEKEFAYPLQMKKDTRGSFTEFLRIADKGQISINIAKPGITKGNHWHHTKNEKFLVVKGEALIQLRKIGSEKVLKYYANGEKLQVIDIPTGYVHSIVNVGKEDLVTVIWANEVFDEKKPDTWYEPVEKGSALECQKNKK